MADNTSKTIETLIEELGWAGPVSDEDQHALMALLHDEYHLLSKPQKATFKASLESHAFMKEGLDCCAHCGNYSVPLFRSGQGRCRECGEYLSAALEAAKEAPEVVITDHFKGHMDAGKALSHLQLAESRSVQKAFGLDADNLSWSDREASGSTQSLAPDAGAVQARIEDELARRLAEEKQQCALQAAKDEAKSSAAESLAAQLEQEKADKAASLQETEQALRAEAATEAKRLEDERQKALDEQRERLENDAREQVLAVTEESKKNKELEEARRREAEALAAARPSLGCLIGPRAGKIARISKLPEEGPGSLTGMYLIGEGRELVGRLYVKETVAYVDSKEVPLESELDVALGSTVQIGGELFVFEELSELESQVPDAIHFARNDGKPGGPWPYWNEELVLGASSDCSFHLVDDDVSDQHARIVTRFGRILIEDMEGENDEAGIWLGGVRYPWLLLGAAQVFRVSEEGPEIKVVKGEARVKAVPSALAMKPSRHKRAVLEARDAAGEVIRRVFIFTRREVRFGSQSRDSSDRSRMINEWVMTPTEDDQVDIGEKQGALVLTREAVDLRWDGGDVMTLNSETLERGKPQQLKRRFQVGLGATMTFDGRVYRSPSSVAAHGGPARLGMKGGHPYECARLDRVNTNHSYVFLVRMLRIGSEDAAPLRLDVPGVESHHCQIMFSQGKFQIVATKRDAPVSLGDVEMQPGAIYPLEINTAIHLGNASLLFREVREKDFEAF
ncbi:MAG: hypothetical protein P1V97_00795 [Planctomycetota bacterium]|nr:hypothetical protein [Planctomycetota bacterium]